MTMKSKLTMGSLFDGSGGFPLAALMEGIRPVWASEVEPFPIRVTTKRLPFMKHLGDVSKVKGGELEPVDIITFGSPCQDLSVAGRQEGLGGSRSGLFFEAVRIIKEMREATNGLYPRFAVWENVFGAFSSNGGDDFRSVVESFAGVKDGGVSVPRPAKWRTAGCVMGDDWSLAWRVLDAQFHGVPQRRRRVFLVGDFGGQSAPRILFESDCVSGHTEKSRGAGEEAAGAVGGGLKEAVGVDGYNAAINPMAYTLGTSCGNISGISGGGVMVIENHPQDGRVSLSDDGVVQTLPGKMGTGGNNTPLLYSTSKAYFHTSAARDQSFALTAGDYKDPPTIATSAFIRRFTPTECARLQGFPGWWAKSLETEEPTDSDIEFWVGVWAEWARLQGVRPKTAGQVAKWLKSPHSDSAEYKMWGNGVALPCVRLVMRGIRKEGRRN